MSVLTDSVISQDCIRDQIKVPGHIYVSTLRYCAEDLSSVLHHIFLLAFKIVCLPGKPFAYQAGRGLEDAKL